jgi:hypothetical protein
MLARLKVWLCYQKFSQTSNNNYISLKKLVTDQHLLIEKLVKWPQPWPFKHPIHLDKSHDPSIPPKYEKINTYLY